MALGLALLENGWQLEAQPGSFFLGKDANRINTAALLDELVEGKLSPEEWRKMCDELGIADLALALPTGSAAASV
jgi:hypothetical protein